MSTNCRLNVDSVPEGQITRRLMSIVWANFALIGRSGDIPSKHVDYAGRPWSKFRSAGFGSEPAAAHSDATPSQRVPRLVVHLAHPGVGISQRSHVDSSWSPAGREASYRRTRRRPSMHQPEVLLLAWN